MPRHGQAFTENSGSSIVREARPKGHAQDGQEALMGQGDGRGRGKRTRAPHVYVPSGRSRYYVGGTLQTSKGSIRLSGSTGIGVNEQHAKTRAQAWLYEYLIPKLQREAQTGHKEIPFSTAALSYLRSRYPEGMVSRGDGRPTNTTERVVLELASHFETTNLTDITATRINQYYLQRFPSATNATIRRHQNILMAVFRFHKIPVPDFDKAKPSTARGSAVGKFLLPDEVHLLISCYPERLQALMALYFVTGARVSELLYLKREHLPACKKVIIPHTKNGDARVCDIPPWVSEMLQRHLRTHNQPEAFLTHQGRPYATDRESGGQFKKATLTAREKAARQLPPDRADVMRRFTPHWTRHTFANALVDAGMHMRDIQEAGGWRQSYVLEKNYLASQRSVSSRAVELLPYAVKTQTGTDDD